MMLCIVPSITQSGFAADNFILNYFFDSWKHGGKTWSYENALFGVTTIAMYTTPKSAFFT